MASIVEQEVEKIEVREAPAELDEVGQVLVRAAEIVRERWQRWDFGVDGGPRCLMGAISEAGKPLWRKTTKHSWIDDFSLAESSDCAGRLAKSLGLRHSGGVPLVVWNDTKASSAEEVAEALERAAYLG